tara:strand:- start:5945 stop:6397 length:453 start_codon:yes stop_codon:yes gene_type:complete
MQIRNKDVKKDAPLLGMGHPVLSDYKLVKKNKEQAVYVKTDPLTYTKSYMVVDHKTKEITVGKILPDNIAKATVKLNKEKQNNFDGYKGKEMVQEFSVPEMLFQQIKEQSGLEARTGLYDEKKAKSILDDPDNKYLKTVPHKIGNRKREI